MTSNKVAALALAGSLITGPDGAEYSDKNRSEK